MGLAESPTPTPSAGAGAGGRGWEARRPNPCVLCATAPAELRAAAGIEMNNKASKRFGGAAPPRGLIRSCLSSTSKTKRAPSVNYH